MWIIFINMHVYVFIIDSSNSLFCEPSQYNWNIVESGVKNTISQTKPFV